VQCTADLQSVHEFRCYDNIQVCKRITLYTANAYSAEREMIASTCLYSRYAWLLLTIILHNLPSLISDKAYNSHSSFGSSRSTVIAIGEDEITRRRAAFFGMLLYSTDS